MPDVARGFLLLISLFKEIPNPGLRRLMVQQLVEILSVPPHLLQRATGAPDQRQTLKARSRAMMGALVTLDHVLDLRPRLSSVL